MTAKSVVNLTTEATTNINDNSAGEISAQDVRELAINLADSAANITDLGANQAATGSGDFVLKTSPTLTTPTLGVATATSINKVAITAPATGSTLTIQDGFTLTVSGSATIASTPPTLGANTFTALQTITQASANAGILASTGYSLTGSDATSMIDLAGTWNTSGTPTAIKLNITNTASAAPSVGQNGSLLLQLQVGGSPVFFVRRDGGIGFTTNALTAKGASVDGNSGWVWGLPSNGESRVALGTNRFSVNSTMSIGWTSSNTDGSGTLDTILRRRSAASLQLGAADAASPVAQILGVQSVVAGTSNTAGAAFTINGSQGTGTGAGGSIIMQTAPAGGSGTSQNALAAHLTITGAGSVVCGNAAIATDATDGFLYIPTCAGTPTGTPTTHTGRVALVYDTTNDELLVYDGAWIGEVLT